MHIAQVTLTLDCGGLEHLAIDLAAKINSKGHKSSIFCLKQNGALKSEAERRGIDVFELDKSEGFDFSLISKLAKLLKEKKVDVVHTHNFAPLIYGTLASKMIGKPCLNTRHGRSLLKTNRLIWGLNKFVLPVSEDTKSELLKNNPINPKKVQVVYNGIDLNKYETKIEEEKVRKLKEQFGIDPDLFVIGHVGRLVNEKDQETLLKAFRKLMKKQAKAVLVIVGDGELKGDLVKFCEENGLTENVKFLGYQENVNEILKIFDIFVLSSITEGLPLTVLEAMAVGKPIIATKIGGNPEVVVEGETGYLVPCGFPERIETAIMRFYVKRELIPQLGMAGRGRVEEIFNLEKMADEYIALYEKCAGVSK